MKFGKFLTVAALISVGASVGLASGSFQPVEAATTESAKVAKSDLPVITKTPLTKEGYILRVVTDAKNDTVYVGKSNYNRLLKNAVSFKAKKNEKTINPKQIRNVKFRIERIANPPRKAPAGALLYLVASKDKKYSAWVTESSLQYYYQNSKSMSGVVKPLKRIANRTGKIDLNTSANKRDYNAAMKAAKKLKGSQKTFVVNSLKQFKKDSSDGTYHMGRNILLFGIF